MPGRPYCTQTDFSPADTFQGVGWGGRKAQKMSATLSHRPHVLCFAARVMEEGIGSVQSKWKAHHFHKAVVLILPSLSSQMFSIKVILTTQDLHDKFIMARAQYTELVKDVLLLRLGKKGDVAFFPTILLFCPPATQSHNAI